MANALYWSMEATKFAQLLSEKELALNTSQVEAMQLRHRLAELEAELKGAHLLQDRTDHFLDSALLELKKALAAKPATKLQSIAKEAPATKNPRDGVCGNHCEWWLVRDGKCALGYSSWQACKEAAGKGK